MGLRVFFLLGALLFLTSTAFGQGGPPGTGPEFRGGRPMMGPMLYPLERMAKDLNLTEDQIASLQDLRQGFLRDTLPWRDDLVIKRMDLQDLLRQPQTDSNQVLNKQREVSELESKIQERVVIYQLEVRKVFTPEQTRLLPPAFDSPGPGRHRM
ncbi:MAG: periplasmic heavy metal sensor, partial [Deltaproteobacteria bacterium]